MKPEDTIHDKQITRKEALAELYPALSTPLRAEPIDKAEAARGVGYSDIYEADGEHLCRVPTQKAAAIVGMSERRLPYELLQVRGMLGLPPDSSDQDIACAVAMLFARIQNAEIQMGKMSEDAKRLDLLQQLADNGGFESWHNGFGKIVLNVGQRSARKYYEEQTLREAIDKAALAAGGPQ